MPGTSGYHARIRWRRTSNADGYDEALALLRDELAGAEEDGGGR